MVRQKQKQSVSSSHLAMRRYSKNTDHGQTRADINGALSEQDEELPDLPSGGMILDDSIGERDYSLTNDEVLRRIGIK